MRKNLMIMLFGMAFVLAGSTAFANAKINVNVDMDLPGGYGSDMVDAVHLPFGPGKNEYKLGSGAVPSFYQNEITGEVGGSYDDVVTLPNTQLPSAVLDGSGQPIVGAVNTYSGTGSGVLRSYHSEWACDFVSTLEVLGVNGDWSSVRRRLVEDNCVLQ